MPDSPGVTIVSRAKWGAAPPKRTPSPISTPTRELWLHHFAAEWHGPAGMKACQDFHQNGRGWNDIAYSFCIDDDGTIYEGRGAGVAGGHTKGHNTVSHAICLMGDFDKRKPTQAMIKAAAALAAHGRKAGWWGEWSGGHRDASGASTACPGRNAVAAFADIKHLTSLYFNEAPTEEDEDMYIWRSAEEARPFVEAAYLRYAGRQVESEKTRETWVYAIVTDPKSAFDMISALHNEHRARDQSRMIRLEERIAKLEGRPYNGPAPMTEDEIRATAVDAVTAALLNG